MAIHLPIADITVNVLLLLAMGGGIGFLSGLFGVGGGFLMTPMLIFIGVPPPIAVASGANQIVAASVSGLIAHWRRGNVDFKMGGVLLAGGALGSVVGVVIFNWLRSMGQVELLISLCYVIFLGVIGGLMLTEAVRTILRGAQITATRRKLHQHNWLHGLPLKMRFRRSRLYISALVPAGIGFAVGVLGAIMGVGGGFIMVPAMIYILGMPTSVVVGTSLFQILFVMANVTLLQSIASQTVDIVLAIIPMLAAVVGAQIGTAFGSRLKGEELRGLLAVMVLLVCGKMAYDLVARPFDLFSLGALP